MSKICNGCNINKDLSNYYKDSKLKSGYRGKCKDCTKAIEKNKISKPLIPEINRICSVCKVNNSINDYYKNIKI